MSLDDVLSTGAVSGLDIAFAVLTLIVTWIAFVLVKRITQAAVDRISGLSPNVRGVIVRITKYLVLLLGVGIALAFLGVQLQPLLIAVIIVVAIIGIGLRGVAANFGAGILIQARRTILLGDEVESMGYTGVVTELNGRSVLLRTNDGRIVHIPNHDLLDEPLTNFSKNGAGRSEVEVRLDAPGDITATTRPLLALAGGTPGVLAEPAPDVVLVTVEPARLTLRLRFWHEPLARVRVTSNVVAAVGDDLRTRGLAGTVTSARPDPPLTVPPRV